MNPVAELLSKKLDQLRENFLNGLTAEYESILEDIDSESIIRSIILC